MDKSKKRQEKTVMGEGENSDGCSGKGRESRDGRENRRHWRNNGVNAAKALTAAMATVDSRGVGGKDSNKASNGDSSNGDCRQQGPGRKRQQQGQQWQG